MRKALAEPHRSRAGAQDPRQQRRHDAVPAQPDAAGARLHRQLRRAGSWRHAVHPPGLGLGSTIIGTIPGGYGDAWRTLTGRDYPTWNVAAEPHLPARRQRRRRQLRAGARAAQPVGGAAARARAAGGDRSHQRGAAGREQPEALRGGRRGAGARAKRGFEPNRAASKWACPRTSSSSRRSATWRRRRTPNCGRCSTTGARSWTTRACRKLRRLAAVGITAIQAGGSARPATRERSRGWSMKKIMIAVVVGRGARWRVACLYLRSGGCRR